MAFVWTDGDKIGHSKSRLKGLMGAKEIYGQVKTMQYLQQVRAWAAQKSPTAQRILKTVDNSSVKIYLVGMNGGFTCFDSDPAPAGTIYFDLNLKVSVNPGGATNSHKGFERLHPYVAFLHEVGHAVQFIKTPRQFVNHAKGPLHGLKSDIEAAARKYGERNHGGIAYAQRRAWFSQGPLSGTAWAVRLEYDNVYNHERPICLEAGEPLRDHYTDIKLG
jgi:hypothetical protein